jgi:hypothetical protein
MVGLLEAGTLIWLDEETLEMRSLNIFEYSIFILRHFVSYETIDMQKNSLSL